MAKKTCKFGKVSRGARKGHCRKHKKAKKKTRTAAALLNGRRSRRRR